MSFDCMDDYDYGYESGYNDGKDAGLCEYKTESQIRQMLERFQKSDLSKREVRRTIAATIMSNLKNTRKDTYSGNLDR